MQFYDIDIPQIMISRLYSVYNKHGIIKLAIKPEINLKYYRKCSNNFAADCMQMTIAHGLGFIPKRVCYTPPKKYSST